MDQQLIQDLFLQFATPLSPFVGVGGRKEAVEQLARNLWLAFLAGPAAEEQFWSELADEGKIESELQASIQKCFDQEMKPAVSTEELQEIRQFYGISLRSV